MIPSLSELRPHLLNPELKEADCLKAIRALSAGFTVLRDRLGRYGDDRDLVSAYTQLYLPTNWPKLSFVLSQLKPEVLEDLQDAHFIDFGCGPGTYSLAWSETLRTESITLVDHTKGMIDQAKKLLSHFRREIEVSSYSYAPPRPEGKVVLFFGHSINELPENQAQKIVENLDPDYVFFIEPGTSEFFVKAKNFRASMIERGMSIAYPCPSLGECPNNWCHQVWRGTHDQEIERLCQIAQIDRRTQPMTAHLYSKKTVTDDRAMFTRFLNETKFSFEWESCLPGPKLSKLQWQKKNFSKSEVKQMQKKNVGERFDFEIEKELGDGVLRVKTTS